MALSSLASAYTYCISSRDIVTWLQDIIDKLASSQRQTTPTPISAPSEEKNPDTLIIPDVPKPLDEDDYPNVLFWYEDDWIKHIEQQKDGGKVISRLGFLTDNDGNPMSESQIKIFKSTAKQVWNELYRHRLDPNSWTKKTPKAATYLCKCIEEQVHRILLLQRRLESETLRCHQIP